MGLRQATDEGLSYSVYIVQKRVSCKSLYKDPCTQHSPCIAFKGQDVRGSKQMGLQQATDEGLSYPVYIVQTHKSL